MSSSESYLRELYNSSEITKSEFDALKPKNVKPERHIGYPKSVKVF